MRSWLSRISLFGASAAAVDKAVHELAPPAVLETLEQRRLMSASASDVAALPPAALAAASSNASSSFDVSGLYEGTFKAKVDGKRQTVRFQLTVSQVGRKLTGRVTAGGLNVQFVGHLQKNQFKLVLDGSPAAGVAVGRVGRNGEKLGGVITFSDGGDVIKGKFAAVEGAAPLTSSAPRVIIGGENTNTGGGTTTPGTGGTTDPGTGGGTTPVDTGGGGAVVDPGEGLPPGFPDGPPAEEPPTEPPPGGDPGQLPPPTDPIDGPVDPGTLPPGNGGTGGSNNNGTGGTPGGGTGGSVNNVGEPGTMVGNNWGIIGRFNGVFNGRVAKVDPAAPNNPNFRVGTDDRNTVMRVTSQTDDGAIAGTIQVEGVGTFGWTGFINGRVFDFVLDNGAGEGNGRVSDNRRGLAGDLLVETSGYRAKGHYAVVWDGVIVGPGPGPGPGTPGWDVIESNAEDGILIGDLATAMDLSDDGDIQNQTGNDPDPDDEDDVQQYNVPTLEYPPELFRTFAAGADNIVIDALGIADVVAPAGNGMFTIGVTSDDGFAVFVNDVEVLSAAGPRVAGTVVTTAPVAISDGDEIRVIYYENFGSDGELNVFIRTATGDFAIGDPASGVVVTVPGTTPPPPPPPPPPPGGPPPPPPPPPVGPPPTGPLSSYPGGVVRTPTGPGIFGGNSGEVPVDEAPPV